jgi:glutaminase
MSARARADSVTPAAQTERAWAHAIELGYPPVIGLPDEPLGAPRISTGTLPAAAEVAALVAAAHERYAGVESGRVADYIPALAETPPGLFGICVASVEGGVHAVGDADIPFSIQSISKPFVFALVCEALGFGAARARVGVNATGLPFNSIMAIELNGGRPMNPMVNAGAIATTALVPGASASARWDFIRAGLSAFAGRDLQMDPAVYASEAATNQRNRGIAQLLQSYGHITADPEEATDLYTRQCALAVTARDLAIMGATLADGGVNPVTGARVVEPERCKRVLAVLATAGLYERSGDWLYEIGLPGKSGVSGGIVTIAPGKGGLGTFAPPLDEAGNSLRGQLATRFLSERLGLNLFASHPVTPGVAP